VEIRIAATAGDSTEQLSLIVISVYTAGHKIKGARFYYRNNFVYCQPIL